MWYEMKSCHWYDALHVLPSHKFCETFADLRSTIEAFKTKWDLDRSAPREGSDDGDSDCDLADLELEEPVAAEGTEVAQLQNDQHDNSESQNESPSATLRRKNQEGTGDDLQLDINGDFDSLCVTNPSQASLPDLDMSEWSQELLQQEVPTDTSSPDDSDLPTKKGSRWRRRKLLSPI
ncbi:hypothetical protein PI124_g2903 [Phytophthora idaei]|nr:hypothetical protein PI125_g18366 [Phytophthora idaei]KAG3137291.1 hypothetical protein PI126_g17455 [Phytophthora idaei]KAG3252465.1 hypothetical protein PI124_g2903 [Phytophthora idaei]